MIEIKTCKSIDLFQIERYLIETNVLIMIKIPTDEVVSIHNFQIKPELIKSISSLIRKKQRLTDNDTRQVQGDGVEGVLPFLNVGKRLN